MTYMALDVREYTKIGKTQFNKNCYGNGGDVTVPQTVHVVVIARNLETGQRERFDFFPAYTLEIGGKEYYGGFKGNYELIIPGDIFEVTKNDGCEVTVAC